MQFMLKGLADRHDLGLQADLRGGASSSSLPAVGAAAVVKRQDKKAVPTTQDLRRPS